mmetsp:Transcript_47076/g.69740  ORF Transcript_47076/g.69740 Transcript_47076/m.69740 type:complete len:98 (-) Transcript_47076:19-312(-)
MAQFTQEQPSTCSNESELRDVRNDADAIPNVDGIALLKKERRESVKAGMERASADNPVVRAAKITHGFVIVSVTQWLFSYDDSTLYLSQITQLLLKN